MTSILAVAYKGTKKKTQWHVSCYEVNGFPNPHRFSAPIQFNHSSGSCRGNILHHEGQFPGRKYRRKRALILLGGDRHNEKQKDNQNITVVYRRHAHSAYWSR